MSTESRKDETEPTFSQEDLNRAAVSNWNAALEEIRDVMNYDDVVNSDIDWPWKNRLAEEIEKLKR